MPDLKDKTDIDIDDDVEYASVGVKQVHGRPKLYKPPRVTELDGSDIEVYVAELQKAQPCNQPGQ